MWMLTLQKKKITDELTLPTTDMASGMSSMELQIQALFQQTLFKFEQGNLVVFF